MSWMLLQVYHKISENADYGAVMAHDAVIELLRLERSFDRHMRKRLLGHRLGRLLRLHLNNYCTERSSKNKLRAWYADQPVLQERLELSPAELGHQDAYRPLDYLDGATQAAVFNDCLVVLVTEFGLDLSLLYEDASSSYFEGDKCELGRKGYSRDRRPGFLQLLVADKVHQYKAKASDQGIYFHRLIRAMASHRVLALTGTLFGGKSSTIFWLLYRMCSAVRQEFGFHDERRWVARYGLLERTVKARESETDGAISGTRRYYERGKEIPGISPAIIRWLLPVTIFARLTDLGHRLPTYTEKVFVLDMENYQGAQYDQMDDILVEMMRLARSNGDNGMVSVWLQASLARPNSAFREEWVMRRIKDPLDPDDEGQRVRVLGPLLPAVAGGEWLGDGKPYLPSQSETDLIMPKSFTDLPVWLPKERWLQDYVAQEAQHGRKTLVFVRQTGTRDIRHRVKAALEAKGLRVGILSSNIAPTRREGWVEQHAPKLDVLITNLRLVETGLDLVQFSRGVFFEIEYSLVRRVAA